MRPPSPEVPSPGVPSPGIPLADLSRALDVRLARLHLRTGSLAMARAEYEALVAAGPLGTDDLVDLAEVRWRTGDLAGAGDAAAAHLELGGGSGRAIGIAAEAAAAIGRTVEAERLAVRAARRLEGSVADFFAGIPMRAAWPDDEDPGAAEVRAAGRVPPASEVPAASEVPGAVEFPAATEAPVATEVPAATEAPRPSTPPSLSPPHVADARIEAARDALAVGRSDVAVAHLAIVLRSDPGLAPDVLDAIDGHEGPGFDIVRGDAYRLLGLDVDAEAAFAAARAALAAFEPGDVPGDDPRHGPADGPDPGVVR